MDYVYREFMRWVDRMDTHNWLLVVVGAVIVGFFCLQGFGSRSSY